MLTEEWQEDMAASQGLDEACEFPYLESRISQVELFRNLLIRAEFYSETN